MSVRSANTSPFVIAIIAPCALFAFVACDSSNAALGPMADARSMRDVGSRSDVNEEDGSGADGSLRHDDALNVGAPEDAGTTANDAAVADVRVSLGDADLDADAGPDDAAGSTDVASSGDASDSDATTSADGASAGPDASIADAGAPRPLRSTVFMTSGSGTTRGGKRTLRVYVGTPEFTHVLTGGTHRMRVGPSIPLGGR